MKYLLALIACTSFAKQLVIEFKAPLSTTQMVSLQNKYSASIEKLTNYSDEYFDRVYIVEAQKLEGIETEPGVELVEDVFEASLMEIHPSAKSQMLTSDPLFHYQWGLFNQDQILSNKLVTNHIQTIKGVAGQDIDWKDHINLIEKGLKRTPVVAVVDTGIDRGHPDLKNSIYLNKAECSEFGSVRTDSVADRDNNGYQNDCHGFNFAADSLEKQVNVNDDKNHGTHISGIIAASRNNKLGLSGVSDKIKILPVRVTGMIDQTAKRKTLLERAPSVRIARGIIYAARMKVDVINLSLGWPRSMDTKYMRQALNVAHKANVLIVAAAGNDNTVSNVLPCAYYEVLCVGSINNDGSRSHFSNFGGEVDVVAPGNQIASTNPYAMIPIKFNIQGYDLMSGTSQAAPFVSAIAALLRASNPDMSLDEVRRRIMDSAKKKVDKQSSLHGLVQLGAAFSLKDAPSVKPVFKQAGKLIYNERNGAFSFSLNIKNYGASANNVKISWRFDNQIKLDEEQIEYESIDRGQILSPKISGKLLDRKTDMALKMLVTVNVDGEVKNYHHFLNLAKDVRSARSQNLGFKLKSKDLQLGFIRDGKVSSLLTTIPELYPSGQDKSYFIKFQDKDNFRLHFLRRNNSMMEEFAVFDDPTVAKLVNIIQGDFNYDGKTGFLITTINSIPGTTKGVLKLNYRNAQMEEIDTLSYKFDYMPLSFEKAVYRKTKVKGGVLATPVFVQEGILPRADQVADPWSRPDNFKTMRVYYLEENSDGELALRSFFNKDFINRVKKVGKKFDLIAKNSASVSVLGILPQSREDYLDDIVKVQFYHGSGVFKELIEVSFSARELTIEKKGEIAARVEVHPVFALNKVSDLNRKNVLVEYITGQKTSLQTQKNTYIFKLDSDRDVVTSFLGIFESDTSDTSDTTDTFFATLDHIVHRHYESNTVTESKTPIVRFSFLPGYDLSEYYLPISVKGDGKLLPALYVDRSIIDGDHIFTGTVINKKLVRPAELSLYVPSSCKTLDPTIASDGSYQYTLFCYSSNKKVFYMKYIPLTL